MIGIDYWAEAAAIKRTAAKLKHIAPRVRQLTKVKSTAERRAGDWKLLRSSPASAGASSISRLRSSETAKTIQRPPGCGTSFAPRRGQSSARANDAGPINRRAARVLPTPKRNKGRLRAFIR